MNFSTYVTNLYKIFSKQEILHGKIKAPRCISAHNPVVNIEVYPMLHGFERSLLSINESDQLPFFAKGLNFVERASIVMKRA